MIYRAFSYSWAYSFHGTRFYLENSAALIWIFKDFPFSNRRLLQDDIFYTNNRNVFVVDSETLAESLRRRCFILRCKWLEPSLTGDQLSFDWKEELTCFNRLTFDTQGQRAFLFDCEGEAARLRKIAWDSSWIWHFERYWTSTHPDQLSVYHGWQMIRRGMKERCRKVLSQHPPNEGELRGVLNGLYSLKLGRVVGWEHKVLVSVIHSSLGAAPGSVFILARAVVFYERVEQLRQQDKTRKLARKLLKRPELSILGDELDWRKIGEAFESSTLDWLLVELFPELYRRKPYSLRPCGR